MDDRLRGDDEKITSATYFELIFSSHMKENEAFLTTTVKTLLSTPPDDHRPRHLVVPALLSFIETDPYNPK